MNQDRLFTIKSSGILAFTLGILSVFLVFTLHSFGIKPLKLISPLIENKKVESVEKKITPKLSKFKNTYTVRNDQSFAQQANAAEPYASARAYAVIDYDTGKVIVGNNIDEALPIASLTKIMTAVVALDLAKPSDMFNVTKRATILEPTKIGVIAGQQMSVEELLNAALLTSANDAVQVISDGIDSMYGPGTFVKAMNQKAQIIGLAESHFTNPQGFDAKGHYSSVSDLAILSHYAYSNYPLIEKIVKKDYEFLPETQNHKQFDLYNWNGLIGVYPAAIGFKIGNTGNAGYTTLVLSQREDKKMLAVVLGAPGIYERDLWAASLLDAGYQDEFGLEPVNITRKELAAKYASWKYFN